MKIGRGSTQHIASRCPMPRLDLFLKQNKIKRAATLYLLENDIYDKVPCRFDVVAVSGNSQKKICWVKDAFWVRW